MPGDSGVTVVTTLVCFVSQTAREAAGALSVRHSLRPLILWGEEFMQTSGAPRRENIFCRHCEEPLRRSNPAFFAVRRKGKDGLLRLRSQ
jgi:hypothetical protein